MAGNEQFNRMLQARLKRHGYQLTVDGRAGQSTRAALKDFQRKHGFPPTGIATRGSVTALLRQPAADAPPEIELPEDDAADEPDEPPTGSPT